MYINIILQNNRLTLTDYTFQSQGSRAGGTLRCDSRGCVALTRAQEKRTFGGLVGLDDSSITSIG